jgi:diacylglycerol kinase family enzyme
VGGRGRGGAAPARDSSVLLLLSPDARRRERALGRRIAAGLAHDCHVRIAELRGPGDEERVVELARAWRTSRVVAAGGDGTVSRAAHVALALGVPLGIVPLGTSNSVARALGIPSSLEAASDVALSGSLRAIDTARIDTARIDTARIDTARIESAGPSGPRPVVLLAAIGLHAQAISAAARPTKAALGRLAYVLAGARAVLETGPFAARVELDDRRVELETRSIVVASFAPRDTMLARGHLRPDDGLLEMTAFHAPGRVEALAAMAALGACALVDVPAPSRYASTFSCRVVRIATDPPMPVLVDGDIVGETPVSIGIAPASLRVAVP